MKAFLSQKLMSIGMVFSLIALPMQTVHAASDDEWN